MAQAKYDFFFSFNKVVVNLQFKVDANIVQRIVKNAQFKNTKFVSFFCVFGVFFAVCFGFRIARLYASDHDFNFNLECVFFGCFFLASQIR